MGWRLPIYQSFYMFTLLLKHWGRLNQVLLDVPRAKKKNIKKDTPVFLGFYFELSQDIVAFLLY